MSGPRSLRVAVAEDEPANRRRLVRLLTEAGCEVLGAFADGSDLLDWMAHAPALDALFLDIRMPEVGGFEVLESLGGELPVVLVTAFDAHAVQAFDAAAADYLLKPVSEERLAVCLTRLRQRLPTQGGNARKSSRYPVKAGSGMVFLDLHRTTHFELEGDVVWAHAGQRFRTRWTTLSEVEAAFPEADLLRIHRHLLARPEAIVGVRPSLNGRMVVTLAGQVELECSRGAAPLIRRRFGLG